VLYLAVYIRVHATANTEDYEKLCPTAVRTGKKDLFEKNSNEKEEERRERGKKEKRKKKRKEKERKREKREKSVCHRVEQNFFRFFAGALAGVLLFVSSVKALWPVWGWVSIVMVSVLLMTAVLVPGAVPVP